MVNIESGVQVDIFWREVAQHLGALPSLPGAICRMRTYLYRGLCTT